LKVNGREFINEIVHPGGLREDRPIYVNRELAIEPGVHEIDLSLRPLEVGASPVLSLQLKKQIEFASGRVVLVYFSPDQQELVTKEERP